MAKPMTVTALLDVATWAREALTKAAADEGRVLDLGTEEIRQMVEGPLNPSAATPVRFFVHGKTTDADPVPVGAPCRGCQKPRMPSPAGESATIWDWGYGSNGRVTIEANGFCFGCNQRRDEFAKAALTSIAQFGGFGLPSEGMNARVAKHAFALAGAMLDEREKPAIEPPEWRDRGRPPGPRIVCEACRGFGTVPKAVESWACHKCGRKTTDRKLVNDRCSRDGCDGRFA